MKKILICAMLLAAAVPFRMEPAFADESTEELKQQIKVLSEKQDAMIQTLEEIKSELQIVKIRVSSR